MPQHHVAAPAASAPPASAHVDPAPTLPPLFLGCKDCLVAAAVGCNGQFTYGLNESMTGIVAVRCGPAAAQWVVVRVGMPVKMTE
eukprot:352443-Chlamydomonas_euryale.AAC.2